MKTTEEKTLRNQLDYQKRLSAKLDEKIKKQKEILADDE